MKIHFVETCLLKCNKTIIVFFKHNPTDDKQFGDAITDLFNANKFQVELVYIMKELC